MSQNTLPTPGLWEFHPNCDHAACIGINPYRSLKIFNKTEANFYLNKGMGTVAILYEGLYTVENNFLILSTNKRTVFDLNVGYIKEVCPDYKEEFKFEILENEMDSTVNFRFWVDEPPKTPEKIDVKLDCILIKTSNVTNRIDTSNWKQHNYSPPPPKPEKLQFQLDLEKEIDSLNINRLDRIQKMINELKDKCFCEYEDIPILQIEIDNSGIINSYKFIRPKDLVSLDSPEASCASRLIKDLNYNFGTMKYIITARSGKRKYTQYTFPIK